MRAKTGARIQTKLTVNAPGDVYEQEADRVADQVMRMPGPAKDADSSVLLSLLLDSLTLHCDLSLGTSERYHGDLRV